jgi:hypothetical protein
MTVKRITCPDCALVLEVSEEGPNFKFIYDLDDWRRRCKRRHLGDAVWCLLQRDGTSSTPGVADTDT